MTGRRAKKVSGGEMTGAEVLMEQVGLGSLADAGSAQQDEAARDGWRPAVRYR
jgi:hypothetical protein